MKKYSLLYIMLCGWLFGSCDLLSPDDVLNPNVVESDFAHSTDAMKTWVNGTNASFGTCISRFAELTGLLSDDLYNNSSRSSKTFDVLDIHYSDSEISSLTTHIGKMIEMADFGLETVAAADASTTDAMRFNLYYVKAIAYLLASENFVALPKEAQGKVLTSSELAAEALSVLEEAAAVASSSRDKALVALLKARAYRLLGDAAQAQTQAQTAILTDSLLLVQAEFDDINGFSNSVQEYVSEQLFSVLPRLAAQAVKCPQSGLYNQPIAVAKIEEAHLILAEICVAGNDLSAAKGHLADLLSTVQTRADSTVSTLSVSATDIAAANTQDELYELVYLLRQETFFAEGRRSADMGIRLPMSEVEFVTQGNLPESYAKTLIPAYLDSIRTAIDARSDMNRLMTAAKFNLFPFE
ncbi:MAG: hypothetical protein IJP70_00720 [Bacteroidales bacterium]|nr:hypothetical protein [Bacteroidales bacterium]